MKGMFLFLMLCSPTILFALDVEFDERYCWDMAIIEDIFPYFHEESGTLLIISDLFEANMNTKKLVGREIYFPDNVPYKRVKKSNQTALKSFAQENNKKNGGNAINIMSDSLQEKIKSRLPSSKSCKL